MVCTKCKRTPRSWKVVSRDRDSAMLRCPLCGYTDVVYRKGSDLHKAMRDLLQRKYDREMSP